MSNDTKSKIWNYIKLFFKLSITAFALYWVFNKINLKELFDHVKNSNPIFILLAFIAFIISQIVASLRINTFFKIIGLKLQALYNYKLYLLGMFYNIFLPGGIGGDAYKIFFLNKNFGTETRPLIIAKLLDKLSGVWAICVLILLQILFVDELEIPKYISAILILTGTVLCYLLYYLFFPKFKAVFLEAHIKALLLQVFQVVCITLILLGLGFDNSILPYLIIFLTSAFMALFPFTIGGLGSRELVFLYGAKHFGVDPQIGVTVSLMFFTLSALCSLPGAYFAFRNSSIHPDKNHLK